MTVGACMTMEVSWCRASDTLDRAARLMRDCDLTVCPVIDDAGRVVGTITARDICVAAHTRRQTLREIVVGEVMLAASAWFSCVSRRRRTTG